MPPTDPDRPKGGQDFDDGFWDELADYLEESPRRPDATAADEDDGAPAAGAFPGEPGEPEEPGEPAETAEEEPIEEPGVEDDVPDPSAGDWWDGVWLDGPEDRDAVGSDPPASADAAPTGEEPDAARAGATVDPETGEDGSSDGARTDPPPGDDEADEEWAPFDPAAAPVVGDRPRPRRRLTARTQRRMAVGLLAVAIAVVVTMVGPVRSAIASAARGIGDGAADLTQAVGDRWRSWSTELQTIAADLPARQIDEQRQLEGSESLLFVVEDADRRTVGVAVLALAPDGGSTLALLPPSLYDILPGYGDFPLAEATVFEGPELTALTVSNVLGIRLDDVVTLGPGDVAGVVGGPIQVDLPSALVVEEGGGTQRVLAQAGPGERTAEQAEALMVVRGTSDPLEWLQRQTAVWGGILDAIARDPGVPTRLAAFAADPAGATGTLARAAAGEPEVTVLPVTRVAVAGSEEGFKVSYDVAGEFVERRMAHLTLRVGERPRVEILNGNGRILTTRSVAAALIRRGFRVIKTDNAENFEFESTLVVAQGRDHRAEADEAIAALGAGELLLELRAPSGVVDVSIIVGHDIPAGEG